MAHAASDFNGQRDWILPEDHKGQRPLRDVQAQPARAQYRLCGRPRRACRRVHGLRRPARVLRSEAALKARAAREKRHGERITPCGVRCLRQGIRACHAATTTARFACEEKIQTLVS